jgi:hypothetical protein
MTEHARSRTDGANGLRREPADGAAELGRLFLDLLDEQARHNLEVAAALGRTVAWAEIVRVQGELVRGSLERWTRLSSAYVEIVRTATPTGDEAERKAA